MKRQKNGPARFAPNRPIQVRVSPSNLVRALVLLCLFSALAGSMQSIAMAQDPEKDLILPEELATKLPGPLVEEDPFDLVFLDDENDHIIMKVVASSNPPPKPFPDRGVLAFEFKTQSDFNYQVPWDRVVDYKSYNQLLIDEANTWLEEKEYAKAFRNLLYVYDNGGKNNEQIKKSLQKCLFLDGKANFANEKYELALSIFEDMEPGTKVPGIRSVIEIIMLCYEGILQRNFESGNILRVRGLLEKIREKYPDDSAQLMSRWKNRFAQRSDELIVEAHALAARGEGVAAHDAVRLANNIFPGRTENSEAYNEIVGQFPLIFVGVAQGPGDLDPASLDHWGSRRVGRLTQRTVVEFVETTDEGGKYRLLNGIITQTDDAGMEYRIDVDMQKNVFGIPALSAADLALRMQSYANPDSPNYYVPWAKLVRNISIKNGNEVHLQLLMPFIRPEAFLQVLYADRDENGQPVQNGPYVLSSTNENLTLFELNPIYSPSSDRQHPAIYERKFDSSYQAVEALLKGDIDVVDRVPIRQVEELKANPDITVLPYSVPTMHMLVPNQRNDFVSDKSFRNGLLQAINRDLIVDEMICGSRDVAGCEPVSGPFPIGSEDDDRLAYGYNLRLAPVRYNYKLGMVLVQIIAKVLEAKEREAGNDKPDIQTPPIVLAHPTDDTALIAVRAIARMWGEIGIKTLLKPIENGGTVPDDDDWDFLYVAVTQQEPMTEASRIIGNAGFATTVSAPVEQSLRKLSTARTWQRGCLTLRQIHRQVKNDVSIIPLWQITEYYAYRSTVREVGSDLVHLYEDVERWRIQPIVSQPQDP